jgi:nicotinamide mononucleotide (NMN) deamidase PncC
VRIAVAEAREQFGKPEERQCSTLETVTGGLIKTQLTEKTGCLSEVQTVYSHELLFSLIVIRSCDYQCKPDVRPLTHMAVFI